MPGHRDHDTHTHTHAPCTQQESSNNLKLSTANTGYINSDLPNNSAGCVIIKINLDDLVELLLLFRPAESDDVDTSRLLQEQQMCL
jgi:hypothetical protein